MNNRLSPLCLLGALLVVPALSACQKAQSDAASLSAAASAPAAKADPDRVVLTADQRARLGIRMETATAADAVPVGTVPGVVSLPPEARVAVTTPFAGTVVQVLVIQGQAVRKGEALAVVRAAEAVQYGAALARSQAELPVASASAARLGQLAREGIIAPARADEARAVLRATQATVAENRRLLALGGAGSNGTITLRAPISGRVASVGVDTGGAVGMGPAPFIVENTSALRLDLQVPERLAGQVRAGMPLSVVQDGHSVRGTILAVTGSLDPLTRSLTARASLPPGTAFVPGKGVQVTIAGAPAKGSGIAVPTSAVTHTDAGDVVFVDDGNNLRRVRVVVAGELDGHSIVRAGSATGGAPGGASAGLRAGDRVVSAGIAELKAIGQGQ
ncbi:efflux RND transporter periplasmic adaptor subunit [Novosphingobium sp. FKTRR1]|uniref:efflux RND transporter periplasmic adaptor subunit n=1 Tax=Novosphingobium sp. FKTRR1 TaxID=2879118 RepID=UPI001CEFB344|nr:efflux RND transporter periplasmic adaptor subunit [Novosphingobium sp. FKTRR1]